MSSPAEVSNSRARRRAVAGRELRRSRRGPRAPRFNARRSERGWKDSVGDRPNHSNLSYQNSVKFLSESEKFCQNSSEILKICEFSIFSRIFGEIPREFYQNLCRNRWKSSKNSDFLPKIDENTKIFDEILLRFWVSSGAKAWQSCRSRKMLKNDYLVAKFGFDTEESEPWQVWLFPWKIGVRFGIESFH